MRWLAVLSIALSACGGSGAGSTEEPLPDPPPPPPDVTAQVVQEWADNYPVVIDGYETNQLAVEREMARDGFFGTPRHYEKFRDDCIAFTLAWTEGALNDLNSAESGGNTTNRVTLSGLVEDYRQDFLDYMLAKYDEFDGRGNLADPDAAAYREQIVDGINAVFDDLQADV